MAPKAVAKPVNLGTKRVCPKCSAKFYDFAKSEIDCPKCGHEIDLSKPPTPAALKSTPVARKVEEADTDVTPAAVVEGADFESVDDLDDDDIIVGTIADPDPSDDDNY